MVRPTTTDATTGLPVYTAPRARPNGGTLERTRSPTRVADRAALASHKQRGGVKRSVSERMLFKTAQGPPGQEEAELTKLGQVWQKGHEGYDAYVDSRNWVPSGDTWSGQVLNGLDSDKTQYLMTLLIGLNLLINILMASRTVRGPDVVGGPLREHPTGGGQTPLGKFLDVADLGILIIFTVEISIRFIILRWRIFLNGWTCMDAALVFVSWAFQGISYLRTVRVLRALRLLKQFAQLRKITEGVMASVPRILWVLVLFFLMILVYAVLGVDLFGIVMDDGPRNADLNPQWKIQWICMKSECFTRPEPGKAGGFIKEECLFGNSPTVLYLGDKLKNCRTASASGGESGILVDVNEVKEDVEGVPVPAGYDMVMGRLSYGGKTLFGSLGDAVYTLCKVMTLESWPDIADRVTSVHPAYAMSYFISYLIMANFVIFNLFVALLVDSLQAGDRKEQEAREEAEHLAVTQGLKKSIDRLSKANSQMHILHKLLMDNSRESENQLEGIRRMSMAAPSMRALQDTARASAEAGGAGGGHRASSSRGGGGGPAKSQLAKGPMGARARNGNGNGNGAVPRAPAIADARAKAVAARSGHTGEKLAPPSRNPVRPRNFVGERNLAMGVASPLRSPANSPGRSPAGGSARRAGSMHTPDALHSKPSPADRKKLLEARQAKLRRAKVGGAAAAALGRKPPAGATPSPARAAMLEARR